VAVVPTPATNRPLGASPSRSGAGLLRLAARRVVFLPGDAADEGYEILDGAVALTSELDDGRRQIVEIARAGTVIGLGPGRRRRVAAETLTATVLRPFARAAVAVDRSLEERVATAALVRLAALQEHTLLLGRKTALERVATFLLSALPPAGGDVDLLGLTRQEIGDYLGLTVETVSRNVTRLKGLGVIRVDRIGRIEVRDRAALGACAGHCLGVTD
jgi:CRP-like cAMP-binding protein